MAPHASKQLLMATRLCAWISSSSWYINMSIYVENSWSYSKNSAAGPNIWNSLIAVKYTKCSKLLNSSSPMGVGEMVCGTFLKHLGRPKLLWRNFVSWTSRPVINPGYMVILVLLKGILTMLRLISWLNNFYFLLA